MIPILHADFNCVQFFHLLIHLFIIVDSRYNDLYILHSNVICTRLPSCASVQHLYRNFNFDTDF